ncbi:MAG: tetratricopeptide repeat protein [Paenibacillaceae bacterium]
MDGKQHIQKAYESLIQQDFELAIGSFEKAVANEPQNAFYRYSLSITYARSNKLNKAIEHALEACLLAPQTDNYLLHLNTLKAKKLLLQAEHWLYKDHQRLKDAEILLKSAIQLDPLSLEALLMLALAYGIQERYNEAVQVLAEALKLDPHHAEVIQLLADYEWLKHK